MAVLSESQYNELLGDTERRTGFPGVPQLQYDLQGDRVITQAVATRPKNRLSLTKARPLWSDPPNTSVRVKPEQKNIRDIFDPKSVINLIDSEEQVEEEEKEEEKDLLYPSQRYTDSSRKDRAQEDFSGSTVSQQGGVSAGIESRGRTITGLQTAGSRDQSAAPSWGALNAPVTALQAV
ncbi:uncharacterized protein LOC106938903 isoform X2 [Poecilia latipinna]|uniref:uncharacterized protein LOC106938903 isoform X2 n=1 Tax=Poecilia latipinna TaxID=48699 RepID=UPI00072E69F4|nr:PREDICTED: uncharacterized protein LOC106938903 isoform X2 [Poecilia latipinna]XP_016518759.1 PREDICTED: uncharacterized protein LOC107833594 isoform X2 [Poecilia formosa]